MKSDLSRDTFRVAKHFKRVLMQQGRVQVDADWNEQGDIVTHRIEREAADVIGGCGGPLHDPAFHIVTAQAQLTPDEQKNPGNGVVPAGFAVPDFLISAGRYYVDGILCLNPTLTSYSKQPDFPAPPKISAKGSYVIYADVWERLITALDDPSIREVALGGPDTAARVKTIWQVKHLFIDDTPANCLTPSAFDNLRNGPDGTLSARTRQDAAGTNPCIVPSSAKYTGLENQLYRVEVHDGGAALDVTAPPAGVAVTRVSNTTNQVQFAAGSWKKGQSVEFVAVKAGSDPMNGSLATIVEVDDGKKILTLSVNVSTLPLADMRLRLAPATYKWSRNNGIVAAAIEGINKAEVTVHDLGPDAALGFNEGQWVEVINDTLELSGQPGMLAQILKIDRALNLMTLSAAPQQPLLDGNGDLDKAAHPKVRGWDGVGAIKFHPAAAEDHDVELENGVRLRFFTGAFRTGGYWTIPARTATADALSGNIEWPTDANGASLAQLPFGIRHRYCKLAILHWDGAKFDAFSDCRSLFPPITELTTLLYVGGDGQEAMPNQPIPQLLQAGVFNGRWPVAGAKVRFTTAPNGRLAADKAGLGGGTPSFTATTLADGIASCAWQLDPNLAKNSQQVEARLLDDAANPLDQLLHFNGNLSIASQVFYKTDDKCATLLNQDTVQKAIDRVSHLVSLFEISGNDQEVMPGATLDPLVVIAASICGPTAGQKVTFKVAKGSGSVNPTDVTTKDDGLASTKWTLDGTTPRQQVDATLVDANAPSTTPPTVVSFYANLSTAAQVAFDPGDCATLKGQNTVQKAVDKLADLVSLYEVSGNSLTVPPAPNATLELKVLAASRCGPVSKQRVKFTPVGKSGAVAPADTATGADGTATVTWKLDPAEPVQFVDATLVDEAAPSIAAPTSIRFTAALSLAVDRGITIQAVLADSDRQALLNDSLVAPSRLQKGITVVCSEAVNPTSFGVAPPPPSTFPADNTEQKPTCFLTLDLPYPFGTNSGFPDVGIFGFQPIILASTVSVANNEIHWAPTAPVNRLLATLLNSLSKVTDRVLAHFTLKGNFIWSAKDSSVLLDGDSFGKDGPGNRVDVALPSGNGRKGGDFEMWFWLASEQLIGPAINPTFDVGVGPAQRVTGKVTLGGAPMPGITITLSNPALGTRSTTTDSTGNFAFANVPPGIWTATAQLAGAPLLQKNVTVIGGVNPT